VTDGGRRGDLKYRSTARHRAARATGPHSAAGEHYRPMWRAHSPPTSGPTLAAGGTEGSCYDRKFYCSGSEQAVNQYRPSAGRGRIFYKTAAGDPSAIISVRMFAISAVSMIASARVNRWSGLELFQGNGQNGPISHSAHRTTADCCHGGRCCRVQQADRHGRRRDARPAHGPSARPCGPQDR
jgi:hypothetical protein